MRKGMPPLSRRAMGLAEIGQSSAWETADTALRRASAGEEILMLSLGDPVCPPHPAIVAATKQALDAGRTHYTPLLGEPALRQAIATAEGCDPANIVVLPGAQHAALAVFSLIAGEGDEVLISDPYYATYPGVVAASGAQPVMVRATADLRVDVSALEAAVGPKTRAILLNSPANPGGTALSEADFQRITALAEAHDLWVVVDEVYASFRYDGLDVRAWQHGPKARTVVLNSLSKSHAMTGYRCGWVVAPDQLVAALADWSAAALFGVSQFVQDAAVAALSLPESELKEYRGGFEFRARHVVERANGIQGLRAAMPAGGMFVMLDCRGVDADDQALARALLAERNVAVVPGSGFGEGGRGHLRISLTPDIETLDRAFDRIADHVAGIGDERPVTSGRKLLV